MANTPAGELHKAINDLWDSSSLDNEFKSLWDSSISAADFVVLHDQEASPGQPFPYCIFEQSKRSKPERMSAGSAGLAEIAEVPWEFRIHARTIAGDSRTAKEIANELTDKIMEKFGGHPTIAPQALMLTNGCVLSVTYDNDYGIRTGEDEYEWRLQYIIKVESLVAA